MILTILILTIRASTRQTVDIPFTNLPNKLGCLPIINEKPGAYISEAVVIKCPNRGGGGDQNYQQKNKNRTEIRVLMYYDRFLLLGDKLPITQEAIAHELVNIFILRGWFDK